MSIILVFGGDHLRLQWRPRKAAASQARLPGRCLSLMRQWRRWWRPVQDREAAAALLPPPHPARRQFPPCLWEERCESVVCDVLESVVPRSYADSFLVVLLRVLIVVCLCQVTEIHVFTWALCFGCLLASTFVSDGARALVVSSVSFASCSSFLNFDSWGMSSMWSWLIHWAAGEAWRLLVVVERGISILRISL